MYLTRKARQWFSAGTSVRQRATLASLPGLVVLVLTLVCAPAVWAAGTYTGGADFFPAYVPNDQTPSAVHFTASGLQPSTTYYVKVRFALTTSPSGQTNRGFTWNPSTDQWAQERSDWTAFPQVTTDSNGAISSGAGWLFACFGDTTKPDAENPQGTYYILVSLSTGNLGATLNGSQVAPVTVIDMTTKGCWVHNGAPTDAQTNTRAEADSTDSTATVLSLTKTDFGLSEGLPPLPGAPPSPTGNFRMAVPLSQPFNILLNRKAWTPAQNVTLTQPDVDIALGASDQTPPTAPSNLTATTSVSDKKPASVTLTWTAATDTGSSGLAQYLIYRWTDPTPINGAIQYTSPLTFLGTTTQTSFTDTVAYGVKYYYLVRAEDAATNIGPRSNTALPVWPTACTLTTSKAVVKYGGSAVLSGTLSANASPLAEQPVTFEYSYNGSTWRTLSTLTTPTGPYSTGTFTLTVKPARRTYYRAVFPGAGGYAPSTSATRSVTPRVYLAVPGAPSTVARNHTFVVYGALKPHHAAGSHSVLIRCYHYRHGSWRLIKTVRTTNVNYSTYTRYRTRLFLGLPGWWHLRAYAPATSLYAATVSNYRTVRVY